MSECRWNVSACKLNKRQDTHDNSKVIINRGKKAINCSEVAVALGSNLPSDIGPPEETLRAALQQFELEGLVIRRTSRFYKTPCFPAGAGPDYINAALHCETRLGPSETLMALHRIEADFGRTRTTRWAGRTLDLDLIFFDQLLLPDAQTHKKWVDLPIEKQQSRTPEQLLIPHPRLQDRAFVLVPLADVAPDWVHPVTGLSVKQMRNALPKRDRDAVIAL